MISYAWSATQTAATSASAVSAGTTTAIGNSSAHATAATRRPRPSVGDTREAEHHVREQVERGASAEADSGDHVELVADVGERRLHREREEDNASHHRQMQIGVGIARKGGALLRVRKLRSPASTGRSEEKTCKPW
jgi:hypothetical protein